MKRPRQEKMMDDKVVSIPVRRDNEKQSNISMSLIVSLVSYKYSKAFPRFPPLNNWLRKILKRRESKNENTHTLDPQASPSAANAPIAAFCPAIHAPCTKPCEALVTVPSPANQIVCVTGRVKVCLAPMFPAVG